jgi:hypothetical protein
VRGPADGGPDYAREFVPALSEMFPAIFDHRGAALAAVNGHSIAGGCVIAAACDVRVMAAGTIAPYPAGHHRLPRRPRATVSPVLDTMGAAATEPTPYTTPPESSTARAAGTCREPASQRRTCHLGHAMCRSGVVG